MKKSILFGAIAAACMAVVSLPATAFELGLTAEPMVVMQVDAPATELIALHQVAPDIESDAVADPGTTNAGSALETAAIGPGSSNAQAEPLKMTAAVAGSAATPFEVGWPG